MAETLGAGDELPPVQPDQRNSVQGDQTRSSRRLSWHWPRPFGQQAPLASSAFTATASPGSAAEIKSSAGPATTASTQPTISATIHTDNTQRMRLNLSNGTRTLAVVFITFAVGLERSCYSRRRRSIRYAKARCRQGTRLSHRQNSPSATHDRLFPFANNVVPFAFNLYGVAYIWNLTITRSDEHSA